MACEGVSYYDNVAYDEVSEKPAAKEFSIDKKSCYATISVPPITSGKCSEGRSDSSTKKLLWLPFMLFLVVLVLMLGTICACVAFAVEISNLKSKAPLINTELSSATAQLQDLSDAVKEMNTSLLQLQMDTSFGDQGLTGLTQELNTTLNLQAVIMSMTEFSASIRQLNTSHFALNDNFQQLNASVNSSLSASIQQLNTSLNDQYDNFQQLNSFISSVNSSLSASMQQLNTSLNGQYDNFQQLKFFINSSLSASIQQLNASLNDHYYALNDNFQQLNSSISTLHATFLAASCAALPPSFPSGYYWVTESNGSAVRVYCDMTRSCGNVTGGWTRVAYLDMTDSSQQCPSGLRQRVYSGKRTCGVNSDSGGCSSATLPSIVEYTKVCGRIRGYQIGSTDAFHRVYVYDYVDGVTLTYGNPRQHIWTFAAGLDEIIHHSSNCPCITASGYLPPEFVGNDYFCDTGASGPYQSGVFYGNNSLWDGVGCGSGNECCSFNTPPWFYKQLPQPTTDNIEMSVCRDEDFFNEDVAIELIEIYIH